MAKKIYLSPSNQNANIYKYGNTNECVQCNRIADYAKKALERCGFSVKKAPQGQDMGVTIAESNGWGADLHIPIHTNAYNGNLTGGTLVMLYSNATANNKAGKAILNAVAPISPGKDYTLRYNSGLAELNSTSAIAVYLEVEFHDTTDGAMWIIENAEKIGEAIAKGVCDYYGVKYVSAFNTMTIFETAAVQVLLRQAHEWGIVQTYVTPVDNKKGTLTNAAIIEAKKYFGHKTVDTTITEALITDLDKAFTSAIVHKCLRGDFNGDGKVDIKDATAIQKHLVGIE